MTRRRLDAELVRRGLAATRSEAQEAVRAGLVSVGGAPATKAATLVAEDQPLVVAASVRRFVSRGGEKLRAALDRFGVDPRGRDCLDAGASTGGFTDCLLQTGAARVAAVDVGYGQLAWELRTDPRVAVLERTNVRELSADDLPFVPDLVTADLSFISLRPVAPRLTALAAPEAELVVLVKPQFEAGPEDVRRGGVVRDAAVWRRVLGEVADALATAGAPVRAAMASPVVGPAGNVEFLLHARKTSADPDDEPGDEPGDEPDLDAAIDEGEAVRAR